MIHKHTPNTLLLEVEAAFGRALSRLPVVFGVSRQTLYSWCDGERPNEVHRAKLIQIAAAARTFSVAQFTPTSQMLDRAVAQGNHPGLARRGRRRCRHRNPSDEDSQP